MNFEHRDVVESSLDDLHFQKAAGWTNYPKGVLWAFNKKGHPVNCGFDILLYGNIPNGSGLSSSASVEVVIGVMLKDMLDFDVTMIDIALLGQYAENNFNVSTVESWTSFLLQWDKQNNAIFLDTSEFII